MTNKSDVDVQEKAEAKPTSYTGSRMQNLMTPTEEADSFVSILGHKNVKSRKNINPYYNGDQNMLMYRNSFNVQGRVKGEQVMIRDNLMIENKESVTDAANYSKSSKGSGIKNSFKQMMMRIISRCRGKPAKEEGQVYSVFEKTLTEKDVEGKLLIPAKFARYFPKTISNGHRRRDVKLQFVDPGGRFWEIKWVKDGSQYFFRGKWKDIVAEHELKSGDIIVIELSHDKHFPIRFKKQTNILSSSVTTGDHR